MTLACRLPASSALAMRHGNDHFDITQMERMERSLESVTTNFASLRTGRANPAMLDRVKVCAWTQLPYTYTHAAQAHNH